MVSLLEENIFKYSTNDSFVNSMSLSKLIIAWVADSNPSPKYSLVWGVTEV
jgi:hypothetical protein